MSFFWNCYWTENLLCCSTSLTMPSKSSQRQRGNRKFWNLQHSKFVNLNGAKMVDVWNVNKLNEAKEVGANVNFGISIWKTEYRIRNMSVCFDSMPANTFFWHHNKLLNNQTAPPRSCSPEQNRESQKNWAGQEKFDIYLCVFFDCYCQI